MVAGRAPAGAVCRAVARASGRLCPAMTLATVAPASSNVEESGSDCAAAAGCALVCTCKAITDGYRSACQELRGGQPFSPGFLQLLDQQTFTSFAAAGNLK